MEPSASTSSRRETWLALGVLAATLGLTAARAPHLLLYGRFWAEEATEFFHYAWHEGFFAGLVHVHPRAAYLVFPVNLAGAVASLLPLKAAPWVMPWCALAVQGIAPVLILFSGARVFATWPRKLLACAFCALGPTMVDEVWLNMTNSAGFLGIVAVLVLLDDSAAVNRARFWRNAGVLGLAAFSGPYVTALAPVFGLAAFLDRARWRFVQLGIVAAGGTVNLLLFAMRTVENTKRGSFVGTRTLEHFAEHQLMLPVFGRRLTTLLEQWMGSPHAWIVPAAALIASAALFLVPSRIRPTLRDPRVLLFASFVVVAAATVAGSMHGLVGGRYAVVPGFIVMLLLLHHVGRDKPPVLSWICAGLLVIALVQGPFSVAQDPRLACSAAGWSAHIEHWERSPREPVPICPPGWELYLVPR